MNIKNPMHRNATGKTISNICLSHSFKNHMAEEEGFEPPRALTPLSVFKTDPFSRTWVFLRFDKIYYIMINWISSSVFINFFHLCLSHAKDRVLDRQQNSKDNIMSMFRNIASLYRITKKGAPYMRRTFLIYALMTSLFPI